MLWISMLSFFHAFFGNKKCPESRMLSGHLKIQVKLLFLSVDLAFLFRQHHKPRRLQASIYITLDKVNTSR